MKRLLFIIPGGLLLLGGCKEVGPAIDFSNVASVDSSYTLAQSAIPATAPHNVLVENFSGQSCPNCPAAESNLASEETQYPGRVNIIALYTPPAQQALPPTGSVHDLEDSTAYQISQSIYNDVGQLPTVGVDRLPVSGGLQIIASGIWDATIISQTNVADSLNLSVQSKYDTATKTATTIVTVTYTQAIAYSQNMNIAIVEDSIYDIHEEPLVTYNPSYRYMDVFRGFVTSGITGDVIYPTSPASKQQGLVYRRTYTYSLPAVLTNTIATNPPIIPNHCRVIAFITNSTNGIVAQSIQTPLMGQ